MRKILLLLIAILSAISFNIAGQTVKHYSCTFAVDQNGVRHKISDRPSQYFTFANNNSIVYMSDKNGNKNELYGPWKYIGEKNGVYVYKESADLLIKFYPYLYMSKSFDRINLLRYTADGISVNYQDPGWTYVYEEKNPNDIGAPSTFY